MVKENDLERKSERDSFLDRPLNSTIRMAGIYVVLTFLGASALVYTDGSLDYKKWGETQEQREVQREDYFRRSIERKFGEGDLDGNGSLDFGEFYRLMRRGR